MDEINILENLRIRVTPELNLALDELCKRKKLKKQEAVQGFLSWFVRQDSRLQSLIVGQIEPEFHATGGLLRGD